MQLSSLQIFSLSYDLGSKSLPLTAAWVRILWDRILLHNLLVAQLTNKSLIRTLGSRWVRKTESRRMFQDCYAMRGP